MRLRQVVDAARDLGGRVAELRARPPYREPGDERSGLRSAVLALGESLVEVAAPFRSGAAAARCLGRRGAGPHRLLFQVRHPARSGPGR